MKILIICHEFPPFGGGAANATFYLAKHLANKQNKITVVTSRFKGGYAGEVNFNVVYLPVLRRYADRASPLELLSFALSGIFYSLFCVRNKDYNVCIAIHGIPGGWVGLLIYKLFRIPYIVSLRGADVPGFLPESFDSLHKKVIFLTRIYWKNAVLIIANSTGLKELADLTAKPIHKDVKIIPNGIDLQMFKPDNSLRENGSIRIVFSGRLTLQKGLDNLLLALKESRGKIKNKFSLKVIGDGPLKERLIKNASSLIREGAVIFCGRIAKEELLIEYKRAHIFILPSLYEGMSNSLLEAMACGCMVIASDIAGNNELVKEGENGFLFEPNDKNQLREILITTLNNKKDIIEEMGSRSRRVAEKYDWDTVAGSYFNYINMISEDKIRK